MDSAAQIDRIIGSNLRAWRQRRGLSGAELGATVAISYQQVHKYEGGESRLPASYLVLFADRLETPLDELCAGIDGVGLPGDPLEAARIQRCAGALALVPEPIRGAVESLIRSLHDQRAFLAALLEAAP